MLSTPREAPAARRTRVQKHTSVELFAGAGGLAVGLARAGFVPASVVEIDKRACETLRANGNGSRRHTRGWSVTQDDVAAIDFGSLPPMDLLSAGAPCQPFSIGGRLRGTDDHRNMFPEVIRAIREAEPRAFILENVRGLLFPRARPYFDYLLAHLHHPTVEFGPDEAWEQAHTTLKGIPDDEATYHVEWRLLHAPDYGLAQHRVRLVVVGFRSDVDFSAWHWPEPSHSRDALLEALHGNAYWDEHEVPAAVRDGVRASLPPPPLLPSDGQLRWRTVRDVISELGPPLEVDIGDRHFFVPGARLYKKHNGSALDWPSKTVKAGVNGSPGGEHIVRMDDETFRYLSVRECATLQGFPRDYWFPEQRRPAMRLIGNAVPVAIAEAVGTAVARALASDLK
jgi:DNA (cytosine-5)-methyltransferase 1